MKRISKAIQFAAAAHDGQLRKLSYKPYIFHVTEVAQLTSYMTDDEDTVIAALLHDTVEDTNVTLEDIEKEFGRRVRQLVEGETEDKMKDRPKGSTWKERKIASLNVLKNSEDIEEKKIWLADKVSNMRSMFNYHQEHGREIFDMFNEKDPANHKWYYEEIAKILNKDFSDEPVYKEYVDLVNNLFEGY